MKREKGNFRNEKVLQQEFKIIKKQGRTKQPKLQSGDINHEDSKNKQFSQ